MVNGKWPRHFPFHICHVPFAIFLLLPSARGLSLSHAKPRKDNLEHSVHVSRGGEFYLADRILSNDSLLIPPALKALVSGLRVPVREPPRNWQ
jgi:hypothetical protein